MDDRIRHLERLAEQGDLLAAEKLRHLLSLSGQPIVSYGPTFVPFGEFYEEILDTARASVQLNLHPNSMHSRELLRNAMGVDRLPRGMADALSQAVRDEYERVVHQALADRGAIEDVLTARVAIQANLDSANGRRRTRTLDLGEALYCLRQALASEDGQYGVHGGRVANAYGYPARTTLCLVGVSHERVGTEIVEANATGRSDRPRLPPGSLGLWVARAPIFMTQACAEALVADEG